GDAEDDGHDRRGGDELDRVGDRTLQLVCDLLAGLPGDTEVTLADGAAADSREPLEVPDDGGRVEVEEASAGFVEGLDVRGGARPQVPEEVQGDVEQQVEDEGDDEQHERCRQQSSEDE